MKTNLPTTICSVIMALAGAACDQRQDPAPTAPDNTARNKVDRDPASTTPVDQSQRAEDIRVTADIRRAIMDDRSMSVNAQNCKIITAGGVVTLRGVVNSQAEKDAIESKARTVAGVVRVDNSIEVKPS